MKHRTLGSQGLEVSPLGVGCMGMASETYGPADEAEAIATLHRAFDLGLKFLDTSDVYGPYRSEQIVGRALKGRRDEVVVGTKFWDPAHGPLGSHRRRSQDRCRRPGGVSSGRPAMRHCAAWESTISTSTTSTALIRRCRSRRRSGHSPSWSPPERYGSSVSARSPRQSPSERMPCIRSQPCRPSTRSGAVTSRMTYFRPRARGIGVVAYSLLGRGFLSGRIRSLDDLAPDDYRRTNPRFLGENFQCNLDLLDELTAVAERMGCSPARLALAWVMGRGDDIVAIPGAETRAQLEDNAGALDMVLTEHHLARIEPGISSGMRSRGTATRQNTCHTKADHRCTMAANEFIVRRLIMPQIISYAQEWLDLMTGNPLSLRAPVVEQVNA